MIGSLLRVKIGNPPHNAGFLNNLLFFHAKNLVLPAMDTSAQSNLRPLRVGITGGIGSGKTTVCRIFEVLEIPVYYADERAKWLMTHDPAVVAQLKALFGPDAYDAGGNLQRAYIAQIVFNDPDKLSQLNTIVHPAVGEDAKKWMQAQQNVPYTLREAALIFETGIDRQLDYVIVVTAPEALRVQRVVERDRTAPEAVKARIAQQMPEAEKVRRADFVIINDGQQSLIRQVLAVHRELRDRFYQRR